MPQCQPITNLKRVLSIAQAVNSMPSNNLMNYLNHNFHNCTKDPIASIRLCQKKCQEETSKEKKIVSISDWA